MLAWFVVSSLLVCIVICLVCMWFFACDLPPALLQRRRPEVERGAQELLGIHIYIYIYITLYVYIYIYIERERDVHICMYIYIYTIA